MNLTFFEKTLRNTMHYLKYYDTIIVVCVWRIYLYKKNVYIKNKKE